LRIIVRLILRWPAQLLDRLLEREALHLLVVELGNDVVSKDSGPELPYQTPMHHRQRAADHALGKRAHSRSVQRRLDEHPEKMRQRRETVEHPFGTIKVRMGATHFLTKTLPRVATEMALHVLGYNLTRVMNIIGVQPLMAAMRI
jgi:Transposase DDE domain